MSIGTENSWPNAQCKDGNLQSPIEIDPRKTDFEKMGFEPFVFKGYNQTPKRVKLMNAGFTIKAIFDFDEVPQVW